jgi:hypothetical protein
VDSVTKYVTRRFLPGIHISGTPYLSEANSRDAHVVSRGRKWQRRSRHPVLCHTASARACEYSFAVGPTLKGD